MAFIDDLVKIIGLHRVQLLQHKIINDQNIHARNPVQLSLQRVILFVVLSRRGASPGCGLVRSQKGPPRTRTGARPECIGHGLRDTLLILLMVDAAARTREILDIYPADSVATPGSSAVTLTGKGQKTRTVPIMDNKTGRHVEQNLKLSYSNPANLDATLFYAVEAGQKHQMSLDNLSYIFNMYAAIAKAQCPEVSEHVNAHQLSHARAMQMLLVGGTLAT